MELQHKHNKIASRHFSAPTLKTLAKANIFITSVTYIPGLDGTYSNGETAYQLSDGRIRTFLQILEITKGT